MGCRALGAGAGVWVLGWFRAAEWIFEFVRAARRPARVGAAAAAARLVARKELGRWLWAL